MTRLGEKPSAQVLRDALKERVLVLDGAMGTMIQRYELSEEGFRGERFKDHPSPLQGANDLLVLSQPHIIEEIHRAYLEAGADLIETNTFSSSSVGMAEYGVDEVMYELNLKAAEIARRAAIAQPPPLGEVRQAAGGRVPIGVDEDVARSPAAHPRLPVEPGRPRAPRRDARDCGELRGGAAAGGGGAVCPARVGLARGDDRPASGRAARARGPRPLARVGAARGADTGGGRTGLRPAGPGSPRRVS